MVGEIASMYFGNIMLLVLNLRLVERSARLLLVPSWILFPMILGLFFAGLNAASSSA